ncbi:topology modulation protein [Actinoplanes sp. L3-i22]|uniref:topology modulation protein n=1 Tax=Actinoplanes sp. L3-i22 TaxID=2836373 RepID=UPI001C742930|nr:topology modulation protein [Actinoplanes sp. L3-i22]BCY11037.1 DNA topology modulation protein FlaR [Actinoplanes sp. L3-i22]
MQRIAIVGNGGAGKTVLANRLGAVLGIPVTHLDDLRYAEDGTTVAENTFADQQQAIVAGESWIVEGNSLASMPIRLARADTVIVVDPHPLVCLLGILQRRLRYRGGRHPDGVFDRINGSFLWYVGWRYRRDHLPRVQACISDHFRGAVVVHLTRREQANLYLDVMAYHRGRGAR